MKVVDVMEKVFQSRAFKNRVNVLNKSFPNFWNVFQECFLYFFLSIISFNVILNNAKGLQSITKQLKQIHYLKNKINENRIV